MAGRHSTSARGRSRAGSRARRRRSRVLPVIVLLLVVGLVGAGYYVLGNGPAAEAGCDGTLDVSLAAAPEIAPVVEKATEKLEADDVEVAGTCVDYAVEATAPERVADLLTAGPENTPDLWVPDFSVWV